ncbi:hypothetical protein Tco_0904973 [Tanacetum coccineum]
MNRRFQSSRIWTYWLFTTFLETATYGMVKIDDDLHDLRSMEAEFPATVIDDAFAPQDAVLCKSRVSTPVNDEIKFRISFDESDDEDYVIIYDKNSFSYKMIYVNNLKTDLENDNEKADIPSFQPPKPMTSYVDDVDLFKDFENEFPAIVYNDAQMSKSNLLTELILNPQHIDKFDLNNETSLSEYDERTKYMAPLPPREQIYPFIRYQGLEYTDADIADFEERLERIYSREIHKVQVVDFQEMPELIRDGLFARMGTLVWELILEFLSTLRFGEVLLDLDAPDTIQFQLGGVRRRLSWSQFILALGLHTGEEMESPSFARFVAGRKSRAHISGGQFVGRLAQHFGLLTAEILRGLTVIAPKLPIIDMAELVRLQICEQLDDTWAWVALGPERQPDVVAGAPTVVEDAPAADKGDQAEVHGLRRDVRTLRGLVERSMTDQGRFSTWMMLCMAQLTDASGLTYQALDGTFRGSSPAAFQRRTRQRTGEASTSAAQ